MRKALLPLLAVPLVMVACSKTTAAPTTTKAVASPSTQTPPVPFPSGPPNTSVSAAPANAKYACEYLTAAVDQLSSDDQSVNKAVGLTLSGVGSTLAASANNPAYTKLNRDARALLVEVVRLQVQLKIERRSLNASEYPASFGPTVRTLDADCR